MADSAAWGDRLKRRVSVFEYVLKAVFGAEYWGDMTGLQKKKFAVARINDWLVNIPGVPESVEGIMIEVSIDCLIWLFNRVFGHNWRKHWLFRWLFRKELKGELRND